MIRFYRCLFTRYFPSVCSFSSFFRRSLLIHCFLGLQRWFVSRIRIVAIISFPRCQGAVGFFVNAFSGCFHCWVFGFIGGYKCWFLEGLGFLGVLLLGMGLVGLRLLIGFRFHIGRRFLGLGRFGYDGR